jgi:hypothetical protein
MFFDAGNGIFLSGDAIASIVLLSDFDENGSEEWFIKAYGWFELPEKFLNPDGGLLMGPFKTREEALKFIGFLDEEVTFEAEDVDKSTVNPQ